MSQLWALLFSAEPKANRRSLTTTGRRCAKYTNGGNLGKQFGNIQRPFVSRLPVGHQCRVSVSGCHQAVRSGPWYCVCGLSMGCLLP
jgi:hypothetical protein